MVTHLISDIASRTCAPEGNCRFRGLKIGLFGGSFNPPHAGHTAVAKTALKTLGLDEVWWLPTPGNPLKETPKTGYDKRVQGVVRHVAGHPQFRVSNIEGRFGLRYTVDTIATLRAIAHQTKFVFLMSADSFQHLHHWKDWETLANRIPIAIFNRKGYSIGALHGRAANSLRKWRVSGHQAKQLVGTTAPAWAYIHSPNVVVSSTELRSS